MKVFSILLLPLFLLFGLALSSWETNKSATTTAAFIPDTAVNGIQLLRWRTTLAHFGEDTSFVLARIKRHKNYDFPYADFTNSDESQRIQLFVHLGYGLHELAIAEIRVKWAADFECRGCVKFPDDAYITSNGIQLGMTKEAVLAKAGKASRDYIVKDVEVLEYRISNNNSSFLQRYNQPSYFAYYRFKDNVLKDYHIGFDTH
jgi:hypothetical protein